MYLITKLGCHIVHVAVIIPPSKKFDRTPLVYPRQDTLGVPETGHAWCTRDRTPMVYPRQDTLGVPNRTPLALRRAFDKLYVKSRSVLRILKRG